jgi:uncharacterized membrane protein
MKKTSFLLIAIVISILFLPTIAFAYEPFEIVQYDVIIDVHENNTMDIVENITVNFFEKRHGIIFNIPKKGSFIRKIDGEVVETNYKAKVDVTGVLDHNFEVSKDSNGVDIKIGDANVLVEGIVNYSIVYSLDLGDDGIEAFDDFYYNVIGSTWDVTIKEASILILMPKAFDTTDVEFISGYDSAACEISFDRLAGENAVYIELTDSLPPYHGCAVRIMLEEGYFTGERMPVDLTPVAYIVSLATALLAIILFLVHGNDKKIDPLVNFSPPKGVTPAEIGYIVDGVVDSKDVTSLIIYWANRGYLMIEECEDKTMTLSKVAPADNGMKKYEKYMFDQLFVLGDTVNTADLENVFYTTVESVKKKIAELYRDKATPIYTKKSRKFKALLFFLMPIPVALSTIANTILTKNDGAGIICFVLFVLLLIAFLPLSVLVKRWHSNRVIKRTLKLIIIIVLLVVAFVVCLAFSSANILLGFTSTCLSFIIGFCAVYMFRRTDFSHKLMAEILGLKDFIIHSEKEQIDRLVDENAKYFYNVLPYAYVLNISDKWSKRFESIAASSPAWYHSNTGAMFTPIAFNRSMNTSLNRVQRSFNSMPSSSGSGGSGGSGGFSSGGAGGSSGSSW